MTVPSLTSSAVMQILSSDRLDELYKLLKIRHKNNLPHDHVSVKDKLDELGEKYFDLVWYARKYPEDREIPEVNKQMTRVEEEYPLEIENYLNSNDPDWQHGFNSGALAIIRLLNTYAIDEDDDENICECDCDECEWPSRKSQIEYAEELFPFLDT